MNKKILGLFLMFGIVAAPAQSAAFNNELNGALARRAAADAAEGRRNAAQANIIAPAPADPIAVENLVIDGIEPIIADAVIDHADGGVIEDPFPVVNQVINNQEPVVIVEDVAVAAEEDIEEQPAQPGGFRSFFSRSFGYSTQTNSASTTNNAIFKCTICKRNISATATEADNKLEQTPCGHNFHKGCLTEHKDMGLETCPDCDTNLNEAERYTEEQIYKCPVCIEPLLETDEDEHKVFATPCQHFFHKDCLAQACQSTVENWGAQACPICRQQLNTVAAPLERAQATNAQIRNIEQRHQWELGNLQNHIAQIERVRRHDNGNRLPGENIPHVAPVHHEPENQGGTNITTTKALGLVATGAAAASVIPGASQAIKSGLTTAGTKAYELACAYPKETAGGVAIAGTGYALSRCTDARQVGNFLNNREKEITTILLLSALGAGIAYSKQ